MTSNSRWRRAVMAALVAAALASTGCGHSGGGDRMTAADVTEETIRLWEGLPPGAKALPRPETRVVNEEHWRTYVEIHNVSNPSMTMIRPADGKANGSAMVVLPGGAFGILAWDLEGTEVGEFLADRGITAFVLKYRVSDASLWGKLKFLFSYSDLSRIGELLAPKRDAAVEDAMQAIRILRTNAATYGIDPDRVGMMGFSAGAITTMTVVQRADASARPNIAASIYGMAFEPDVPVEAPPLLMVVAKDDTMMAEASAEIQKAWTAAGKRAELHVLESGGHGFGMGRPGTDSMRFPELLDAWLRSQGFIEAAP